MSAKQFLTIIGGIAVVIVALIIGSVAGVLDPTDESAAIPPVGMAAAATSEQPDPSVSEYEAYVSMFEKCQRMYRALDKTWQENQAAGSLGWSDFERDVYMAMLRMYEDAGCMDKAV